jgi:hypothetical protein
VEWLLTHGAAEDLHVQDVFGVTPLHAATAYCNPKCAMVALNLILEGGANDPTGRVCPEKLASQVNQKALGMLKQLCMEKMTLHGIFVTMILPCVALSPNSAISSLSGLERTVLAHVADFAGVYRGAKLRTIREFLQSLNYIKN